MEDQPISIFPEKRVVYGNFGQRFLASFIDGILIIFVNYFIGKFIGGANLVNEIRYSSISTMTIVGELLEVAVGVIYFAGMESSASQATLGKQALGLIVTDVNGNRISFGKATGRHFAKWISILTLLIGYLMNTWDSRGQTLHDKIAGTLVVKK